MDLAAHGRWMDADTGDEIYSSDREGECAPERETEKQFPLALKHILIRSKMIALWI
jgi:hypothetical protein